ncbi:MAG: hypothetical protein H0X24_12320 [Ktedonobacterales bacterium]|nr:hypothetical protein [Ktedonobacterales bacterium]
MPSRQPFILSLHIPLTPPPFADLAAVNLICGCVLLLCLLVIGSLRARMSIKWPVVALLITLGAVAITFGVNVYFARTATPVFITSPSHWHPLGTATYPAPYDAPFKTLYACTALIILATIGQTLITIFLFIRRLSPPKPVIT